MTTVQDAPDPRNPRSQEAEVVEPPVGAGAGGGEAATEEPTKRSRRRKNVIGGGPHREEYERLLKAGWSSIALERYAAFRFGEDIPASTFRAYKARKKIVPEAENPWGDKILPEKAIDVLEARAQLIQLQQARIAIDFRHEQDMNKLFGTTKGEISTLSSLLNEHKADLQDLGLLPKLGMTLHVEDDRPALPEPSAAGGAPRAQTLGELLGLADPEQEMAMAKVLHLAAGKNSTPKGA